MQSALSTVNQRFKQQVDVWFPSWILVGVRRADNVESHGDLVAGAFGARGPSHHVAAARGVNHRPLTLPDCMHKLVISSMISRSGSFPCVGVLNLSWLRDSWTDEDEPPPAARLERAARVGMSACCS